MEIVQITVEQIIVMFMLIVVGVICYHTKILDSKKSRVLSDILIKVITPALIIDSFQREFEMELLKGFNYNRADGIKPWDCICHRADSYPGKRCKRRAD